MKDFDLIVRQYDRPYYKQPKNDHYHIPEKVDFINWERDIDRRDMITLSRDELNRVVEQSLRNIKNTRKRNRSRSRRRRRNRQSAMMPI
jgi:hypothetical protein